MPERSLPLLLAASAVAAAVFALLIATAHILPMAWDEGNAINRAAGIREWMAILYERPSVAFSDIEIRKNWHYTVEIEGHPSLYGAVIACGQWFGELWFTPLTAARFGPMALFSVAAGAMFHRLARQYSFVAGIGAGAAMLTMPRLFAHAHFASFDGPLTSCWMLAWALFPVIETSSGGYGKTRGASPAVQTCTVDRSWCFTLLCVVAWGAALGAAMSSKFTGWLAPLPFIGYAIVYGNRKAAIAVCVGLLTAFGSFWLLNPRLWHHPIDGLLRFFDLNLFRAGTPLDIPTLFFGTRYTQVTGLPWYNTLVWTGITVPVGTLLFGCIGITATLRRWLADGEGMLLVLNWAVLMAARALPGAPVHDAERLILPSFAFLAAVAGVGCHFLLSCMAECVVGRRILLVAVAATYIGSASSVVWYAPQWLSYYNLLIGGLRGADAAGMEATYYWDALDNKALVWLEQHTGATEKIDFAAGSTSNLKLMERWGILRRRWRPNDPGDFRWRVIQRRPTFWSECDRQLIDHGEPALVKTIRPPNWGFGPWRLDVPLIEVFSYSDFEALRENSTSQIFGQPQLQLVMPKNRLDQLSISKLKYNGMLARLVGTWRRSARATRTWASRNRVPSPIPIAKTSAGQKRTCHRGPT